MLFGLLMASRKLHHYFQAHEIVVTRFSLQREAGDDSDLVGLEVMRSFLEAIRRPKSNFCTPEYLDLAPRKRELTK